MMAKINPAVNSEIDYGTGLWTLAFKRLLRNKAAIVGGIIIVLIVLVAIFADFIAPYNFSDQFLDKRFVKPFSSGHLLGTDNLGRDMFSRIVYGSRYSLSIGISSILFAMIIGSITGTLAGYIGGVIDNVLMRLMDILLAIPPILLAICISASLGTGLINLIIAIGISNTPTFARIARASVLVTKDQEYIEAAKATGARHLRIILKYILPNIIAPLIVQITLGVAVAILSAAALGFLGLGIQPPQPEWGTMLASTRAYMLTEPYLSILPGLAIAISILALNLLGDGLRDALDPKLNR